MCDLETLCALSTFLAKSFSFNIFVFNCVSLRSSLIPEVTFNFSSVFSVTVAFPGSLGPSLYLRPNLFM